MAGPVNDTALLLTSLEQEFLDAEIATNFIATEASQNVVGSSAVSKQKQAGKQSDEQYVRKAETGSMPAHRTVKAVQKSSGSRQKTGEGQVEEPTQLPGPIITLIKNLEPLEAQLASSLTRNDRDQAATDAHILCKAYNTTAMKLLDAGGAKHALSLLEKAQVLCDDDSTLLIEAATRNNLLVTTLNNMACCHHRMRCQHAALKLLQRAALLEVQQQTQQASTGAQTKLSTNVEQQDTSEVTLSDKQATDEKQEPEADPSTSQVAQQEVISNDVTTPVTEVTTQSESWASTQLNMCAVLSSMRRHEEALRCAQQAVRHMCDAWAIPHNELLSLCSQRQQPRKNNWQSPKPSKDVAVCVESPAGGDKDVKTGNNAASTGEGISTSENVNGSVEAAPTNTTPVAAPAAPTEALTAALQQELPEKAATEQPCKEPSPQEEQATVIQPGHAGPAGHVWKQLKSLPPSASSVLTTCVYNEAVQLEFVGQYDAALDVYHLSVELSGKLLGRSSNAARLFRQSLQAFKSKYHGSGQGRTKVHAADIAERSSVTVPGQTSAKNCTAVAEADENPQRRGDASGGPAARGVQAAGTRVMAGPYAKGVHGKSILHIARKRRVMTTAFRAGGKVEVRFEGNGATAAISKDSAETVCDDQGDDTIPSAKSTPRLVKVNSKQRTVVAAVRNNKVLHAGKPPLATAKEQHSPYISSAQLNQMLHLRKQQLQTEQKVLNLKATVASM